jgi:hypothetical protein
VNPTVSRCSATFGHRCELSITRTKLLSHLLHLQPTHPPTLAIPPPPSPPLPRHTLRGSDFMRPCTHGKMIRPRFSTLNAKGVGSTVTKVRVHATRP